MDEKQTTGAMPASDMSETKPAVPPMPNFAPLGSASTPGAATASAPVQPMAVSDNALPKKNGFFTLKPLLFTGILLAGMGLAGTFAFMRPAPGPSNDALSQQASSFEIQDVDLSDLATSGSLDLVTNQSLSVNGQLRTNNSLVIAPSDQPVTGSAGQLYFDRSAGRFGFYDGTDFDMLAGASDVEALRAQLQGIDTRVTAIPPVPTLPSDIATLGSSNTFSSLNTFSAGLSTSSLSVTGNGVLQGSLTVNGATTLGPTTISTLLLNTALEVGSGGTGTGSLALNGVVIGNGSNPLSTATYASGGQCLMSPLSGTGAPVFDVCPGGVGYGVNSLNGLMGSLVIANATASGSTITINDASNVAKGIASFNSANLTVTSGSVNTVQNISSTATPTFAGLLLTSDLSVPNGGTGASSFTANGIIIGNGTSALGTIAPGSTGQCLLATAGAPSFQDCPATPIPANVSSLNGLTGALVLNNASTAGSTITVNDASTASKGIASFNSTNFSVSGGAVNTIQNINTLATPTFAGINTGSLVSAGNLTVSSAINTNLTLATSGTGALYFSGYDCSASGNNGKLTVDATGQVICAGDSEGADNDTLYTAGNGLSLDGSNQFSVQLQTGYGLAFDTVNPNGLGLQACGLDEVLKSNGSGWVCASDSDTPGDGSGITTIGALDNGTFSADGASIGGAGSVLYLQSASNLHAGLVNLGAQSFAGAKTFNANTTFAGGLNVSSGQSLALGASCASGEVLTTDISGVVICVTDSEGTDTDTLYTAGSGLNLSVGNEFSANIRTGFGLQADGNGISLIDTCALGEVLKRTAGGWACAIDSEGTDNDTLYTAGDGLNLDGSNQFSANIRTGFGLQADSNGLALLETCTTDQVLKRNAGGWGCAADNGGDGAGITAVGAIDSEAKSANGAVITGSTIVLQNADGTNGGLVSIASQTFGGAKTFNLQATFAGGLVVSTGQSITLGAACAAGEVLTTNLSGVMTCVVDSEGTDNDTLYTAGDGLSLSVGNQFSTNIRTGFGLQADGSGIALIDTCALGEVLKRTAGGWACGGDSEGNGVTISGTYTDGRLTKFNATGQIMNSNLSEAGATLTYSGNMVVNAGTGYTGNLLDLQLNGTSRFSVNQSGTVSVSGLLGAYGGIDTNNQNISAGNGTITGALNSTTDILLNGNNINTAGTLTNVAYLNQANTFSANTTVKGANFSVQNTASTNLLTVNTVANTLTVGTASSGTDTFTKLTNPATLPTGSGRGTTFSPDGQYMSVAHDISPFITIYKRSGDTFTKLANPATLPAGIPWNVAFSPDSQYMSVAHLSAPYITIYKRSGDTFTKLANPATLPTGNAYGTTFSPDGQYMSVGHSNSPFITIYKRSGDTFTKLANPTTLPTGTPYGTTFSPDGQYMSVAHDISPFITIYKRSGDTFTKLANPTTLPTGMSIGTAFSPDGQYMSVGHSNSPFITIYKRSGDTFTKLADPAVLPTTAGYGTAFSLDGNYMSVTTTAGSFITIYKRSGDTFTKLADPTTLPTGAGNATAFSPDSQYMSVVHGNSPFVTIYKVGDGLGVDTTINGGTLKAGNTNLTSLSVSGNTFLQGELTTAASASVGQNLTVNGTTTLNGTTTAKANFSVQNSSSANLLSVNTDVNTLTVGTAGSGTDSFTKLTNPLALPGSTAYGTAFSSDGQYMSVVHNSSPYVSIYKRSGDSFTKLADPATLPTGVGSGTAFSSDGQYMSVAHSTSPFITIYKRSGDTFTKLANPTSLPPNTAEAIAFSPDGQYMSVGHAVSPFLTIYKRSGDTFAKLADPAILPGDTVETTAFSPDGQYMSVGYGISPFVFIYKRSGDTFTKLADPATLPASTARGVTFSPDGQYMSVAHSTSPNVTIYKRSGDTFTKLADPATLPASVGHGVTFSPDSQYMSVAHTTSPNITIYKVGDGQTTNVTVNGLLAGSRASFSALNISGATILQDSLFVQGSTVLNGNLAVDGTLSVGNLATFTGSGTGLSVINNASVGGTLTVSSLAVTVNITVNGHIISGGSTPTIVAGTAACSTPTVTVAGSDTAGTITVTTGTGCAASGKLATLTFASAFGAAPRITLTPATANATGLNTYIDSGTISTTAFDLGANTTPTDSTTYKWYYHAIQ